MAAYLGLPFAFASHFAPEMLQQALDIYRAQYRPSAAHPKPHAMVGLNVVVAESDAEKAGVARMLAESIVGSPLTVRAALRATQARTGADEFIVACAVHDTGARLRSYELLAALHRG